ncbi:MAG: hypothetical protein OEM41_01825, partial [Ignavibacteria bacterium]|nr:hypothetical protein [Ignavibacteria bacterium]
MQSLCFLILIAGVLSACSPEPPAPEAERPIITLDSLAVTAGAAPRSFFLSDKRGGFLIGTTRGSLQPPVWTAFGEAILSGLDITMDGKHIFDAVPENIVITPTHLVAVYPGGLTMTLSLLGVRYADSWMHAFIISMTTREKSSLALRPRPRAGEWKRLHTQNIMTWEGDRGKRYLHVYGGPAGQIGGDGILFGEATQATVLMMYGNRNASDATASVHARLEGEMRKRDERVERLLNDNYVRTGNARLNRALWWSRTTLDGLVLEADDTAAVAGLPWDGSFSGRALAHSLSGISVANSDSRILRSLIRWLARWQDTDPSSVTYGRIATRFDTRRREYTGADVGPDFVRQMYEIVSKTNDTSLVRELYPAVRRSIEGTLRYHSDTLGFLTHGGGETWMDTRGETRTSLSRGNRAVELQTSWYYQQLISSFLAARMRDTSAYREWNSRAARTLSSFNRIFIDSSANLVYDHLTSAGRPVQEGRPNALFSIDLLNAEKLQQNIIITIVKNNVYRQGVATLSEDDPRFTPHVPSSGTGERTYNGPVWTWLNGQAVYSLSRYDRQDLAFHITSTLIDHLLDRGMVGALPALMDAQPRAGSEEIHEGGASCSLDGVAEFIR